MSTGIAPIGESSQVRDQRHWVFRTVMGLAAAVLALGVFAYAYEVSNGLGVTGMRDVGLGGGATWGMYIGFVVYFVGVSFAGITVAALIRLLGLDQLRAVGRMAEVLTVVSLVLGALLIIADLGQPLRGVVNLFLYARPQSPFFGTFTLVIAGYLFASLVYLYLDSRRDAAVLARREGPLQWLHRFVAAGYSDTPAERERHERASFWLAVGIIPLLVMATSTLGFVFGLQVGRPGWFSALQAPAFVTLAAASGLGLLIVLAALVRHAGHHEDVLDHDVFAWLGRFLLGALLVYVYFMIVELLTATYTAGPAEQRISEALLTGRYAPIFWTSAGLLVAPMLALLAAAVRRTWSVGLLVLAGVAVNLGAIGKRYLIVVPSQTEGELLPYGAGAYSPTWVEYSVVGGLFALGVLLIGLYLWLFPVVGLREEVSDHA